MKKKIPRRRIDVNVAELDRIIDGAKSTPLSESDSQKLKTALHALAERLLPRSKTEKTSSVFSDPESAVPETDRQQRDPSNGHGRNGADAYRGAKKVEVAHPKMAHGDRCPDCARGNIYTQKEPKALVRIVGQAPLAATVYELERLRCNACGQVFTAEEPEGVGPEKYDETAAAMIAQLKYGSGVPFHRLERMEELLGIPLPAATQWELVEETAALITPAHEELIRQAAQGEVLHNDDTGMRVLEMERDPSDERTGVFTSGIVSTASGPKDRVVFYGPSTRGREPRRRDEAARARSERTDPDVRCLVAEHAETVAGRGDSSGQLPGALSGLWNYPERMRDRHASRGGNGVSGILTPDKASQTFEECEQLWRWPPLSRGRRVKPGSLPKGLQHVALHLKIGRNVSACGGHRCMTEIISNHRNIDSRLQKGNGTTVSHDVWSDSPLS